MAKIPAAKAAAMFEQIIGWPYQSPGVTDDRGKTLGIDCSGAWVRVFKAFGKSIYHGSNRQFREYCSQTGRITGPGDLLVGMAVFKLREWKDDQRGHRDYGTAPGDIHHVGCVTSVNPLRIVHATPPMAKVDTAIGKWAYWGLLREVEYGGSIVDGSGEPAAPPVQPPAASPLTAAEPKRGQAKVVTKDGKGLNLRHEPVVRKDNGIKTMPDNTIVDVLDMRNGWARVHYVAKDGTPHKGWCSADYLQFG